MPFKNKADRKKYRANYIRKHYKENKQYYLDKAEERKQRLYKDIIVVTKDKSCADCKHRFPTVCMDFDHVRGKKLFNISIGYYGVSITALLKEIEKCDVVCANCHRLRTASRI
jgi:hypothetical protein